MRIAIIADALDQQYAGIHTYTRELIRSMLAVDDRNEYLIIREKAEAPTAGNCEVLALPSYPLPGYGGFRLLGQIPYLLNKKKVDIVIEPRHLGPFNLKSSIKRVTVIHDLTPILFPEYHRKGSSLLQKWLLPGVLRRSDLIVTNSRYTKSDVCRYLPGTEHKIHVAPPGRDENLQPVRDEKVLEKFGIQSPYFLYVGTIEPRKNLNLLLEAYAQFRSKTGHRRQLVIAGKKGWKYESFFRTLQHNRYRQDIVLTGFVSQRELAVLYTMAQLFIYPSLYEGFGLPILEAMACGTPVLASRSSSLPEVGGEAALYFDPKSADELSGLMVEMIENPEKSQLYASRGKERAAAFNWQKTAKMLISRLEKLIEI